MDWSNNNLSALQRDMLKEWFSRAPGFFLTGGAALVGFYGAPRITHDLDLFTTDRDSFAAGTHTLKDICLTIGAELRHLRTAPYFQRYAISRGGEETIVDIVLETVPQVVQHKPATPEGIIIDPPEEIIVNKICAIVGRSEARDFFDVYYLVKMGLDKDNALALSSKKDGGVNEESLLFVLSSINWEAFTIPGFEESVIREVREFFLHWVEALALKHFPHK